MLDTDQLRSFMAIVDTGSFTRAAERVHKTQSAVSMHIRRLEEQLGRPLFVKNGRGMKLSGDGDRLVEFAREMLRIEATAMMEVGQKGLAGQVRLGIPDDYAEVFMPAIMEGFARQHPFVEVSVICEGSLALADRVRNQELDLALVTDCAAIKNVEVVREEPLVWVAHPRFSIVPGEPLPLALGAITCHWRQVAEAALQDAGRDFRILLVSNNYSAIEPMIRTRLALTVLPLGAVREGMKVLGAAEGLPNLPTSRMGLVFAPSLGNEALALAETVRTSLSIT
ncbi:LysR substrate-binding domain-containing protein [Bradyrhizobium sp. LHD-71]|uniref:LysR substrate-binding domain-containing protein n=1 Tax=Bradyrhizobium sp. LHD-71 TaxID=3072141 RepID=UPI00280F35D7|nr:LysR substrate-binding domain-containing protein [Bradyrhizobium sp. LHD-71]MDQ8727945.1 LysR substrate-binding domain-containing protein [Bradyrhizobium sp. LHD-71]